MAEFQKVIDSYFEKVTEIIDKLPTSEEERKKIWFFAFCEFYDTPVTTEDGGETYGIQTEWQLQQFIIRFNEYIENSKNRTVKKFTDDLNNLKPAKAVAKVRNQLLRYKQKELLSKHGGKGLNNWQKQLREILENELELHRTRVELEPRERSSKYTYKWLNNPDKELPILYELMISKYKLISEKTTYKQFENIFTGQPIDSITPVCWLDNVSLLVYFDLHLTSKVDSTWAIYKRMTACFVDSDGKPFESSFKEIKNKLDVNLSIAKQKIINDLLSHF